MEYYFIIRLSLTLSSKFVNKFALPEEHYMFLVFGSFFLNKAFPSQYKAFSAI